MYGHAYSKIMDQPGKVANPAHGQLTGKVDISLSAFAHENLVSRDGFGNPVSRQPSYILLRLDMVLTYEIPPEFRSGVHLFI